MRQEDCEFEARLDFTVRLCAKHKGRKKVTKKKKKEKKKKKLGYGEEGCEIVLWAHHGCGTHKLTATVLASIEHAEDRALETCSHGREELPGPQSTLGSSGLLEKRKSLTVFTRE